MAELKNPFPDQFSALTQEKKIKLLETMIRIRTFEIKVEELFLNKKIPGFVHLYIGEEAIAAGVMANLRVDDWITSTHRGHGHAIAKGAKTDRMMAELFGKKTGYCKGKGGSMHIADFSVGMLGANGVVGGGFNIAVGAALSAQIKKTDQVAVCFFGDGASNRGTFHEALNLASIWKLPVVFVNENNQYASTTPVSYGLSAKHVSDRAKGYGIEGYIVDGNNIAEVYNAASYLIGQARAGKGPALLECLTYRVKGHYVGDPERYRTREEVQKMVNERDPIQTCKKRFLDSGITNEAGIAKLYAEAEEEISAAVRFAEASPLPEPEDALDDLFSFSPKEFPEAVQ
ncbi:MAG: thiamine pyrophosphate-dependent dehydrogenase E1 component subunit alpha [Rectinema subterraneum]|uniref:thiamine pyrophosphate-dependent dehydrogenase E1 component subunit alpha n=1 Tax=Rectinema subterraneum TaxID=2653714 RepID=UPI003C7E243B